MVVHILIYTYTNNMGIIHESVHVYFYFVLIEGRKKKVVHSIVLFC